MPKESNETRRQVMNLLSSSPVVDVMCVCVPLFHYICGTMFEG